jgi:hypothetical protein
MSNKNIIDLVRRKNTIAWNLQFYDVMWFDMDQIVLVYHWNHFATLILTTFIKENDTKWRKLATFQMQGLKEHFHYNEWHVLQPTPTYYTFNIKLYITYVVL